MGVQKFIQYELDKVYFIKMRGEKVIRKMVLSNEELTFEGPYKNIYILKRTFTIAGIGEVFKYYNYDGRNWFVINGEIRKDISFEVYSDLNGGRVPTIEMDHDEYVCNRFYKLHNFKTEYSAYGRNNAIVYTWDGFKAVKSNIYIYQICDRNYTYSLISPSFSKDDFKEMGYYLTAEECENDNIIEVIDFSF